MTREIYSALKFHLDTEEDDKKIFPMTKMTKILYIWVLFLKECYEDTLTHIKF